MYDAITGMNWLDLSQDLDLGFIILKQNATKQFYQPLEYGEI